MKKTLLTLVFFLIALCTMHAQSFSKLEQKAQAWRQEPPSMHFCTVACYPKGEVQKHVFRLVDSTQKHEIPLVIIGQDYRPWIGNITKPFIIQEYLESIPDEDIVVITDACDVIYCSSAEEILQKFQKMNALIVFATERNCYPNFDLRPSFPPAPFSYKYLNAGGIIGYAGALKHLLREAMPIITPSLRSDQSMYQQYYIQNTRFIRLDTKCEIFHCLYEVGFDELELVDDRVFLRETQTYPCILHGNGDKGKPTFWRIYDTLYR